MKENAVYLVNFTVGGRHKALLSTHDVDVVEDLKKAMEPMGYDMDVTASPSPIAKQNGKTLTR